MNNQASSGVPKTVVQGNQGRNKPKDDKQKPVQRPLPVMAKIVQPTLDDKHRFLMDGKTDRVKQLSCIMVKFFPDNLQEVTYLVDKDGKGDLTEMTTSQFQHFRNGLHRSVEEEEEAKAAKGFVTKLQKRTLLYIDDDSKGNVRKVQALEMPGPAEKMMSLTQEQMKLKEFNNEETMLKHWSAMPDSVKIKMNEFQEQLEPGAKSWTDSLDDAITSFNEKAQAAAEKKASKIKPKPSLRSRVIEGEWKDATDDEESEDEKAEVVKEKPPAPTATAAPGGTGLAKRQPPAPPTIAKPKTSVLAKMVNAIGLTAGNPESRPAADDPEKDTKDGGSEEV